MGSISQATRGWLESGGAPAPNIIGTAVTAVNTVVLEWSQSVVLTSGGALTTSYSIVPPTGHGAVTIVSVSMLDTTHLQLITTDQENGASYQLNVSQAVVQNASSGTVNFATSVFFTGNNEPLTVAGHRLIDATNIIIMFSRAVQQATATVPGNYVFTPTLTVDYIERVTAAQYLLHTGRMQPGTIYTVTVSNVAALDGSVI